MVKPVSYVCLLVAILLVIVWWRWNDTMWTSLHSIRLSQRRLPRVVVSLTTIPPRVNFVQQVIRSMLRQTHLPDEISLHIPLQYQRPEFNHQQVVLPQWLQHHHLVKIYHPRDMGPITKLMGSVQEEKDPETIIITVDDDILYPPTFIESLLKASLRYPRHVIALSGMKIGRVLGTTLPWALMDITLNVEHEDIDVIEGFSGVLYKKKFITAELLHWYQGMEACRHSDDIVISQFLRSRGISKKSLRLPQCHKLMLVFLMDRNGLALRSGIPAVAHIKNYAQCLNHLKKKYQVDW